MAKVTIDPATGALVTGGRKRFPICLSNAPPTRLAEVAAAGVDIIRTGTAGWSSEFATGLIAQERAKLDAAAKTGLLCWLWLGDLTDLPPAAGSPREQVLVKVVNALKVIPRSAPGRASTSRATRSGARTGSGRRGSSAATSASSSSTRTTRS